VGPSHAPVDGVANDFPVAATVGVHPAGHPVNGVRPTSAGWVLVVPVTALEQLLALTYRSKLASLLMGPLVALGDLPAEIVEGQLSR
jgi:hypothetical protein